MSRSKERLAIIGGEEITVFPINITIWVGFDPYKLQRTLNNDWPTCTHETSSWHFSTPKSFHWILQNNTLFYFMNWTSEMRKLHRCHVWNWFVPHNQKIRERKKRKKSMFEIAEHRALRTNQCCQEMLWVMCDDVKCSLVLRNCMSRNECGEPTASYRWTGWIW